MLASVNNCWTTCCENFYTSWDKLQFQKSLKMEECMTSAATYQTLEQCYYRRLIPDVRFDVGSKGLQSAPPTRTAAGFLMLSAYINSGLLTVNVVRGKQIATRLNCSNGGLYVKVSLIPNQSRCKTQIVANTHDPVFNQKFSFELDDDVNSRLLVSVWRRNFIENYCDFVGGMSFDLLHLRQRQLHDSPLWYCLLPANICRQTYVQATSDNCGVDISTSQSLLTISMRKNVNGFGFSITADKSGIIRVCNVDCGEPAYFAGLLVGDHVVQVNGRYVFGADVKTVAQEVRAGVFVDLLISRLFDTVRCPQQCHSPVRDVIASPRNCPLPLKKSRLDEADNGDKANLYLSPLVTSCLSNRNYYQRRQRHLSVINSKRSCRRRDTATTPCKPTDC